MDFKRLLKAIGIVFGTILGIIATIFGLVWVAYRVGFLFAPIMVVSIILILIIAVVYDHISPATADKSTSIKN